MKNREDFDRRYEYNPNLPLKSGGQAAIYVAWDRIKMENVAIKRAIYKGPEMERYSVLQEFERAKKFEHPNLLKYHQAYRLDTEMGQFDFGVMELVDTGQTLDDYLKTKPSTAEIHEVLKGILRGLDYLHKKDVVHRDIKPSNILIKHEGGRPIPKIIDFGVSKEMSSSETSHSAIVGTKPYMAPEQIILKAGKAIKPNCDLWSLGVIIFKIFVGKSPFGLISEGYKSEQIQNNILDGQFQASADKAPEPYRTIIKRCLVKDNAARIQSAKEILELMDVKLPSPQPVTFPPPQPEIVRPNPFPLPPREQRPSKPNRVKPKSTTNSQTRLLFTGFASGMLLLVFSYFIWKILTMPPPESRYFSVSGCSNVAKPDLEQCAKDKIVDFLKENVDYPVSAQTKKVQGEVVVSFIIDVQGNLNNIVIKNDIGEGCGEAVRAAVERMGQNLEFEPAIVNNRARPTEFTYSHLFKLVE